MSEEQEHNLESDADSSPPDTAANREPELSSSSDPAAPADSTRSLAAPVRYGFSAVILSLAGLACYGLVMLAKPTESRDPTALIPQVLLQEASLFVGTIDLTVAGTVVPHKEINVAAEVGGRVLKKYPDCLAGNFVKKGTPLIKIDPESYELEVQTIEAELVQAGKRIEEIDRQIVGEKRNLELAKQDYAIQSREYERSKRLGNAISPSELDQARRNVNAAQTQVTARTNAIETFAASRETQLAAKALTEQRLKRAMLDLRRTEILAPADGVIVTESVQQDAFVRQGEPVLQFENTEVAEVRCNLTTTDLDWIRLNSKDPEAAKSIYQLPRTDVEIFDASEPDVKWEGVLERFSGIGRDPVTKTTPCRILVPAPIVQARTGPRALVRGMFVKCRIEVQSSSGDVGNDLISFSERALQPNGDVWFVREKKLMKSSVKVIDRIEWDDDGKEEVSIVARVNDGDLKPGDTVVISPLAQPTIGTEVQIATRDDGEDPQVEEDAVAKKGDEGEKPGQDDES